MITIAALMTLSVVGQEVPQFDSYSFDGWCYNNPNIELSTENIAGGRVVLYVNSEDVALTLTSPEFDCHGIDSIAANVLWYTGTFYYEDFDLSRATLTMVIDNALGQPVDSVTCVPTATGSSRSLKLRLAVPSGLGTCRLRFVSWTGDLVSSGAIKRATITAIAASPHDDVLPGDVDGDGIASIADVTLIIDYMLQGNASGMNLEAADVDQDGIIAIADITSLIDIILNRGTTVR